MLPEERIKAITLRQASFPDLTEAERQERLRQGKRDQTQERADELDLQAALRVLTHEQAQDLASFALTRLDRGLGKSLTPQSLLGQLANVLEGGWQGMYGQFLARRLFWPGWMYRGADAATRDQLFSRLRELTLKGEPWNWKRSSCVWRGLVMRTWWPSLPSGEPVHRGGPSGSRFP